MDKFEMPPKEKTVIPPKKGWKRLSHYVVDVACNKNNPIHRRILYIGFLNASDGDPLAGGYTCLLSCGDDTIDPRKMHYLKVVCLINEMAEE